MAKKRLAPLLGSSRAASPGSPAPAQVVLKDIMGLVTNMDAEDIPPGASQSQVNMNSEQQGVGQVRGGFVRVLFRN